MAPARIRSELGAAVADASDPLAAADRLCGACARLLEVDGASISLIDGVEVRGTGSSGRLSRTPDELEVADALLDRRLLAAPDGEWTWVPGRDSA